MSINFPKNIFIVCLSGALLSFSAPGYDFWIFAWFGLVPFFILLNTTNKIKESILYAFLFGFCYNFWYLHWIFSIHPLSWLGFTNFQSLSISILSLVLTSFLEALFFVLFSVCYFCFKNISVKPYDQGIFKYLIVTLIWLIIFNKLSASKLLLGFPWTLVEYSQYKNLFLIQISEYFGSISIGFLIVFFNLVLSDLFLWIFSIQKISKRYVPRNPGVLSSIISGFLFIVILIFLSVVFGSCLYKKNQENFSSKSVSISILQGNLPIKATRGGNLDIQLALDTYDHLIKSTESLLVITPEGSLPAIFTKNLRVQNWIKTISNQKQADIISGTYCKEKDKLTNCAASYSSLQKDFSFYKKERLVPFGEFTPFSNLLPKFLKHIAYNIIGNGFCEGKENHLLKTNIGNVGTSICFELIFPELIRAQALRGANLLINLSDLSWFSDELTKKQFLSFAVFRAVENRKPVIVATNNGTSAFIEPSGKIKSQSVSNTKGVLLDWVNPNKKNTVYAKYGW